MKIESYERYKNHSTVHKDIIIHHPVSENQAIFYAYPLVGLQSAKIYVSKDYTMVS